METETKTMFVLKAYLDAYGDENVLLGVYDSLEKVKAAAEAYDDFFGYDSFVAVKFELNAEAKNEYTEHVLIAG